MIRRPPRSTLSSSSAASDVYKRQVSTQSTGNLRQEPRPSVLSTSSSMAGNVRAVLALLKKNAKLKGRHAGSTCCEILLPVVLVLLVVAGFFLSEEETFKRRNYAGELLDFGAVISAAASAVGVDLDTDSTSGADFTDVYNYHGPTPVMDFDQFVDASELLRGVTSDIAFDISQLDTTFDGLLKNGLIALSPDTPEVARYQAWMAQRYRSWNRTYLRTFPTEEEAVDFAKKGDEAFPLWAIIHFDELAQPGVADFTLRFNYTTVPTTKRIFARFPKGLDTEYRKYIYSGFVTLQRSVQDYLRQSPEEPHDTLRLSSFVNGSVSAVSEGFSQCTAGTTCTGSAGSVSASTVCADLCEALQNNNSLSSSSSGGLSALTVQSRVGPTWMVPYPTEAYVSNQFYNFAGPLMGMLICMSSLYPVSQLTKGLVEEKETRMREQLKIMGLTDGALNVAWTLT
eukprot:TRINITY_DN3899_c0_g1_i4.p1 TRINITY_DN3899_c0_g1~~TRINITY_DN3899_c0_g1_i4.p1  ORF type:complete len:455 (-),score=112.16 TRINITY_DN3899_c0_g1_i4:584-1948(-)